MRKRRIGIVDLVSKGPPHALYARSMHTNLASSMPQVIAVWCEQEGHDVTFVCSTGFEHLIEALPDKVDLVCIGAFTEAALLAYALSHLFRSHGAVTVLGGPPAVTPRMPCRTSTTSWASPTRPSSVTSCRTAGSVAKFDFWAKIQKSGDKNSMTYRLLNSRKSNFATEPKNLYY
jgi:hypothetical protein